MRILKQLRDRICPPIELPAIPEPGLVTLMQKISFCDMGLMNGFGDPDHCYWPKDAKPGDLAVICNRHIEEARRLGIALGEDLGPVDGN